MKKVKTVLVYGKFRIVHPGHMRLFSHALDLGEKLIIGIVREQESSENIAFSETLLRNLPFVSEVVIETDESTIIRKTRPQIIVKGFEHQEKQLDEIQAIEEVGAKLIYTPGNPFLTEKDLIDGLSSLLKVSIELPKDFLNRNSITTERLLDLTSKVRDTRVLVLGDVIVDEYIACHSIGMSQEDPLVVNTPISSNRYMGGAGIVAAHCSALGAKTKILSIVGDDEMANWVKDKLDEYKVEAIIFRDSTRPTTLKQRFKNSNQTLFRLTHFKQQAVDKELRMKLMHTIENELKSADLLIMSDFSYGVLDSELAQFAISKAQKFKVHVAADSQSSSQVGNLGKFIGANHIFATEREARLQLRDEFDGLAVLTSKLRKQLMSENVFLKIGADGVLLEGVDETVNTVLNTERIPALNLHPIDVSGAGDSMLASSALTLSSGATLFESAVLGSIAAAIQVGRQGNLPVLLEEVEQVLQSSALK